MVIQVRNYQLVSKPLYSRQRHMSYNIQQKGLKHISLKQTKQLYQKIYAENDQQPKDGQQKKDTLIKRNEDINKLAENLKKAGVNQDTALKVLSGFNKKNVKEPAEIRKFILTRALTPTALILLQTGIDVGATFGAFSAEVQAGNSQFFGKPVVIFLLYFLTSYFIINVFTDIFTLGSLLYALVVYGLKSDQILKAVELIAEKDAGTLDVATKLQKSVDTFKVLNILKELTPLLQAESKKGFQDSSLDSLSAMLTLQKVNDLFKIDWQKMGISEDEASNIAYVFSKFDQNDNFKIETMELSSLMRSLGKDMSQDEAKSAMSILDTNKNGYIDFNEFVQWWTGKTPDAALKAEQEKQEVVNK